MPEMLGQSKVALPILNDYEERLSNLHTRNLECRRSLEDFLVRCGINPESTPPPSPNERSEVVTHRINSVISELYDEINIFEKHIEALSKIA